MDDPTFTRWRAKLLTVLLEIFIYKNLHENEKFGAELVDDARKQIDPEIKVPTVYAMIKKGIEAGYLVESKRERSIKSRGQSRIYYQVTENGKIYQNNMKNELMRFMNKLGEDIL